MHIRRAHHDTGYCQLIAAQNYRIPVHWEVVINKEISKQNELGKEKRSNCPLRSRIVPVKKKNHEVQMCVDFRPSNLVKQEDRYPSPFITRF